MSACEIDCGDDERTHGMFFTALSRVVHPDNVIFNPMPSQERVTTQISRKASLIKRIAHEKVLRKCARETKDRVDAMRLVDLRLQDSSSLLSGQSMTGSDESGGIVAGSSTPSSGNIFVNASYCSGFRPNSANLSAAFAMESAASTVLSTVSVDMVVDVRVGTPAPARKGVKRPLDSEGEESAAKRSKLSTVKQNARQAKRSADRQRMKQSTLSLSAHSTSKSAPSDRPHRLHNHGNTCFANALLQSVFCLPRVRDLLDHGVQPHQRILPEGPAGADNCIYCVLQGMLYAHNGVASSEFHRLMTRRYLGRQQDSHEVIILLMREKRF